MESPLMAALQQFDATEANLVKLERISKKILALVPSGIEFGENPEYENLCRQWKVLLDALPKIDGWKPSLEPVELDALAQDRFDAKEVGELEAVVAVENLIGAPDKELRDYRFRFNQKRRALIRDALAGLIDK